jgi:hypothetical protein
MAALGREIVANAEIAVLKLRLFEAAFLFTSVPRFPPWHVLEADRGSPPTSASSRGAQSGTVHGCRSGACDPHRCGSPKSMRCDFTAAESHALQGDIEGIARDRLRRIPLCREKVFATSGNFVQALQQLQSLAR